MIKLKVIFSFIEGTLIVSIIFLILNILLNINKKLKIKVLLRKLKNKLFSLSYIKTLQSLIKQVKDIIDYKFKFFNSIIIFVFSLIIALIASIYFFQKFRLIIFSILIFLSFMMFPIILLEIVNLVLSNSIKNSFSLYIVSLQNFSKNTNDVISALTNTKALEPLNKYIDEFIMLVNIGFNINKAFDDLINKINIKEISKFFYLLKLCYINGNNLYDLINRFNDYYNDIEKIKKIQLEKRNSYLTTMFVLLIMNVFLLFFVVLGNKSYKNLILNNVIGKIIIDINVLIYFVILLLVIKIIRMEEEKWN